MKNDLLTAAASERARGGDSDKKNSYAPRCRDVEI